MGENFRKKVQHGSINSTFHRYTLNLDDSGEQGPFSVDPSTGSIFVSGPLDREVKDSYTLSVRATDSSPFAPLSAAP